MEDIMNEVANVLSTTDDAALAFKAGLDKAYELGFDNLSELLMELGEYCK